MSSSDYLFYQFLAASFATLFGACVGSFLNVCIYRIPRDESVIAPRSHCPHCNTLIPWYLNIPVLSWLCLRGRCATCKGPISFRYTLVELLTSMLFLAVFMQWAVPNALHMTPITDPLIIPIYWLFLSGLVLGTFVDFEHFIIPDSVTIGGMVVGPLLSALVPALHGQTVWWQGLRCSVTGLAVGFGLLYAVGWLGTRAFKKEAMGFGDVKLLGAIGAFLGWKAVLFTIFASSLLGSVAGLLLIAFGGVKMQSRIPFGPYISMGATVWLFWGEKILALYIGLMRP
ncbi:MAG: prepilin peptidase [Kiritimatiellae bacterium]|nr:prepilin peptidase [Kiritimatiellia bacterium]MDD2346655.1 prepilin peptidase [Kiritimatiellia bacterium]MDD3583225.1 prepilin peptidase [Kiritimatiellia bacterium]HHU15034.1 prepilin peptidase [Lentisphaerota bacterium]HON46238.1 prepilin peptidase [Kiritimatiellia bacterium]